MDLLITVIGNAVVDPTFRASLLANPRKTVDEWGFRLTKGETKMMDKMFAEKKNKELASLFDNLGQKLIEGEETMMTLMCNQRMCPAPGCYPPATREKVRVDLDTMERERLDALKSCVP